MDITEVRIFPVDVCGSSGTNTTSSGNCHFAGEHTSVDFQGYLNGAVESGYRAAGEILAGFK